MKNKKGRILSLVSSTYANYNVEEALSGTRDTGFENIDLAFTKGQTEHLITDNEIKQNLILCGNYNINLFAIAAHDCLLRENGFKDFKRLIDIAETLNIEYITTGSSRINSKDDEKRFLDDINELGYYANGKKVTICVETAGDWIKNGEILAGMVKDIDAPNVRINYDPANVVFYSNSKPEEDIKYVLPYLGYVHLKDKRGGYKIFDFPALGEGSINFGKIFEILREYDVPFSVEIEFDGKEHSLIEITNAVKKSFYYLKNIGFFKI